MFERTHFMMWSLRAATYALLSLDAASAFSFSRITTLQTHQVTGGSWPSQHTNSRTVYHNRASKTTICNARMNKLNKITASFDLDEILSKEKEFDGEDAETVSTSPEKRRRTPTKDKKKKKMKEQLEKQNIEKQQLKQKNRGDSTTFDSSIPWKDDNADDEEDESGADNESLLETIDFFAYEIPASLNGKRIDAVLVDLLNKDTENDHEKESNPISISRSQCGTLVSNDCVFVISPGDASDFQSAWKNHDQNNDNALTDSETAVPHDLLQQFSTPIQRKSHSLESSSILIYPSRNSLLSPSNSGGNPSAAMSLLSNSIPPTEIIPQNLPLDILYEDEYMIVINKQAGIVVHPAAGNWDGTVVNALAYYLTNVSPFGAGEFFAGEDGVNDSSNIDASNDGSQSNNDSSTVKEKRNTEYGEEENQNDSVTNSIPTLRPGIVHRLDKGTTGVLVVAKTRAALATLSEAFAERRVKKQYLAIAIGNPGEDTINKPIGRHPVFRQKMRVVPDPSSSMPGRQNRVVEPKSLSAAKQGRPALSFVQTVHFDGKLSIVNVRIATGRTHQIRVHLQDRGTPIYGDDVYGLSDWNKALNARKGITRPLLHAQRLEIDHPFTGERMEFEAKVADDMMGVMESIWPGDEMKQMFA